MSSFKVESAQAVEDLIEEGDQALPDQFPEDMSLSGKKSGKSKQSSKGQTKQEQPEPLLKTKDYVAATLNAWNNCPSIVKK